METFYKKAEGRFQTFPENLKGGRFSARCAPCAGLESGTAPSACPQPSPLHGGCFSPAQTECSRSNSEARGQQPTLTPQRHSFQARLTQFPKAPRPQVGVSCAHSGNLATVHTWEPPLFLLQLPDPLPVPLETPLPDKRSTAKL